jgi:DNA topoisomerase-1
MKSLIIVESFTKTKTISKYLNNKYEYDIISSFGHINNLPHDDLGINTETWEGHYVPLNAKTIQNIRKSVKIADIIFIASDPDMEGEAIAHHIYNTIRDLLPGKICHRIEFHEITKNAILYAIDHPRNINNFIVDAQESRRFLDRLIGYKLSPLLWDTFDNNTLSVGRVQTVALYICCKLLNDIKMHKEECSWNIIGLFQNSSIKLEFKLYKNGDNFKITNKEECYKILELFNFKEKISTHLSEKISFENPPAPYTTTSLQQDAYNKHRFNSKKTMLLAQHLYENGHITYMRTDSTTISDEFKNKISIFIKKEYGYDMHKYRNHKSKIANAQNAHEAIRITDVSSSLSGSSDMSEDHKKLYKLIWKRTIASQMMHAEYLNIETSIDYHGRELKFINKTSFLIKKGFLIIYDKSLDDVNSFKKTITNLKAKQIQCEAEVTHPKSLYNEVALIKALEHEGIGRPSTYSSIIEKLLTKKYVTHGCNPQKTIEGIDIVKTKTACIEVKKELHVGGKNKDLLVPSELGISVIQYLESIVPFLLDIKFSSNMETTLDRICDMSVTKHFVLDEFYKNYLVPVLDKFGKKTTNKKLKDFSGVMKTKYGYCYYDSDKNKYTNIEPYLEWKKKTHQELTTKEIDFIKSLPKTLEDGSELHIGRYGLYKKEKGINKRLDKSLWDSFI